MWKASRSGYDARRRKFRRVVGAERHRRIPTSDTRLNAAFYGIGIGTDGMIWGGAWDSPEESFG